MRMSEWLGAFLPMGKVVQTGVLASTRRGVPRAKIAGEVRLSPYWSDHNSSWLYRWKQQEMQVGAKYHMPCCWSLHTCC